MSWSIQDLGAAGELVGAIGVVVTLVYLAYQIRQNTHQLEQSTLAARAAAQNASNTALRETRASIFETEEMAEIFHVGNLNPEDLRDVSRLRYRLALQNVTDVMLEIYAQTMATGFAPETWNTQGATLVERILATPGGQWFWATFGDNYPSDFRLEVDRILEGSAAARHSAT
jgi:trehalose-6-phosphatase